MGKYKYLGLKYVIPSILVIVLVIVLGVFFIGGLSKKTFAFENEDFDYDGFVDYSTKENNELKTDVFIGATSNYVMLLDETTTIVSLYRKKAGWTSDNPTANIELLYSSANKSADDPEEKSNLILDYVSQSGSRTSINTYSKSVQYSNITTGTFNRYYQVRTNAADKSVDILYTMGDFAPIVIPDKFNRDSFNEIFIGNTVFYSLSEDKFTSFTNMYDVNDPTTKVGDVVELKYDNLGYCYDNEAALYLLKHGLADISYRLNSNYITDLPGYKFTSSDVSAEDEAKILEAKDGFWYLTNILDENKNLKAKMGVDFNTGTDESGNLLSPVTTNPFIPTFVFNLILGNNGYEPQYLDENDGLIASGDWKIIRTDTAQRILKLKTEAPGMKKDIYNTLYVGAFEKTLISGSEEDGTAVYDYEYAEHPYVTGGKTPKAYQNQELYYDWNQDGIITSDEKYQYGGYHLRDSNGGYIYTEDENGNKRPKQMGFLTEDAIKQNEEYGIESVSSSVAFEICLRFTLTPDGMDVTVLHNSIKEGLGSDNKDSDVPYYLKHDNMIYKLQICKYMTINSDPNSKGMIVLPDGSGCVIEFNSDKSQQYTFIYPEKRIYGNNITSNNTTRGAQSEDLLLPLYGFVEENKAVLAIVKSGAAQTSVVADYLRDKDKGGLNKYNYAFFNTYCRESEKVIVTSKNEYTKISSDLFQGDISYSYRVISPDNYEIDNAYVAIAQSYRNYLLETYPELTLKKDDTTVATPTITFLGAYTKKTFSMGIVYEGEYSMTTFDQAKEIVGELKDNGIENMNVMYRSWTEDEITQKITSSIDVSSEIGGKKKMLEFSSYLKEIGYGFYPEYHFTIGSGYDYSFGDLKYSSKTISGSYSTALTYVLSTGLADNTYGKRSFISPIYYDSLAKSFVKNYKKLDISGIYLIDLGNRNISDYSKEHTVYSGGSQYYQREALAIFKGVENDYTASFLDPTGSKIMLKGPFDFAFSYADVITCAPVLTSLYGSVNYSVPLYQLVLSGIVDYSIDPVNYRRDYSITWNILKAIETGSNLAFVLTSEDTNALLETRYTEYYNSYYPNWKENIIYMNDVLNSTGIYGGYLTNHKYLTDDVVEVEYSYINSNGFQDLWRKIIINYGNTNYRDPDTNYVVRANWFAITEGGN